MSQSNRINPAAVPARRESIEEAASIVLARPSVLSSTPDILAVFKARRRSWVLALGLGLLAAGVIGGGAWFLVPRAKYTAVAALQIATRPKRIMFDPRESQTDYRTYQRTQLALIKNR